MSTQNTNSKDFLSEEEKSYTETMRERFMDFYFERGNYVGRKLGPEEYISFIESEVSNAVAKEIDLIDQEITNTERRRSSGEIDDIERMLLVEKYLTAIKNKPV